MLDCIDGSLIDYVGQVRAHRSASRQRDLLQIHRFVHPDVLGVNFQNSDAPLQIRPVHDDPAVKTAGTQQRLIQDLGSVGGSEHKDTLGRLKAVHLREQLVQGLFSLLVSAAVLGITAAADGVDLVDKDDAGGVLVGFLEQVADTGRTYAYVQFNKVGTGQGEEGNMRFACNRLGQQGLTCSGRSHKKRALGELGSDLDIFARIMQEIDHFLQGFLGLVLACHICEGDACVLLDIFLGRALAHAAHKAAAAGSAEQKAHDHPQERDGKHIGKQEGDHHTRAVRDISVHRNSRIQQALRQRCVLLRDRRVADRIGILQLDLQAVRADVDFLNFIVLDQLHKLVITDPGRALRAHVHHIADHHKGDHRRQEHDHEILAVRSLAAAAVIIIPLAVSAAAAVSSVVRAALVVVAFEVISFFLLIIKKISKHSSITLSFYSKSACL